MTIASRPVPHRRHPVAALLIGLACLGAAPVAAQESGRKHGWADEVKRSLDKPDSSQGEMTGSTARSGREGGAQEAERGKSGAQGRDQARF